MGLLSSLNSWLARKNLELLNDRAKKRAQNRVINWDEYPQGIVIVNFQRFSTPYPEVA